MNRLRTIVKKDVPNKIAPITSNVMDGSAIPSVS
jgi:hypothetical protein